VVDTGAHDSPAGLSWVERLASQTSVVSERLKQEMQVEGIGSGTPSCRRTACISGVLPDGGPCAYKAPVLESRAQAGLPCSAGRHLST
jgi:hypothetical protein